VLPHNEHGASYKQAFLETYLEKKLEEWRVNKYKEIIHRLKIVKKN